MGLFARVLWCETDYVEKQKGKKTEHSEQCNMRKKNKTIFFKLQKLLFHKQKSNIHSLLSFLIFVSILLLSLVIEFVLWREKVFGYKQIFYIISLHIFTLNLYRFLYLI